MATMLGGSGGYDFEDNVTSSGLEQIFVRYAPAGIAYSAFMHTELLQTHTEVVEDERAYSIWTKVASLSSSVFTTI